MADDPNTSGDVQARLVTEVFVHDVTEVIDITIDGEVITATAIHPFWVPELGWIKAKDLQAGTKVQTEDGRILGIDKVDRREGNFRVYNFEVDGFHSYFVSGLEILVHNNLEDCSTTAERNRDTVGKPGKIIRIENKDGGYLPPPPNGGPYADSWYYHDVFKTDDGFVYDRMGWGTGKPIPYQQWLDHYGDSIRVTDAPPSS